MAKTDKMQTLTLEQFVAQFPTHADAAKDLGCDAATLSRWLNNHHKPQGMVLKALRGRGISV